MEDMGDCSLFALMSHSHPEDGLTPARRGENFLQAAGHWFSSPGSPRKKTKLMPLRLVTKRGDARLAIKQLALKLAGGEANLLLVPLHQHALDTVARDRQFGASFFYVDSWPSS